MTLIQRVDALFANYLGEKDELAVVQPIVAPPPPRFNPLSASQAPGKAPPPPTFMAAWAKMDLSHLCGFPTFEGGVFELLEVCVDGHPTNEFPPMCVAIPLMSSLLCAAIPLL